jgi:hypothetical protein
MSADPDTLDTMFAAARADADALPLAEPATLRRAGDRRNRAGGAVAVAGVAGAALAVALLSGVAFQPRTPAPAPDVASAPSPEPTPSSWLRIEPCKAADLAANGTQSRVWSGERQVGITFVNRSDTACSFAGLPELTSASGRVPVVGGEAGQPTSVLVPGASQTFVLVTSGPSTHACTEPKTYRDIAATIGGTALPIAGLTIEAGCGPIGRTWWSVPE